MLKIFLGAYIMKTKIVLFALSLSLIINGCGSDKNKDRNESTVTLSEGDKTAPVITLQGDKKVLLSIGENYQDQGATAIDNIDGDLSSSIQTTTNINFNIAGNYTITYQVSDTDKNSATAVRDIIIQDIIQSPKPREGLTINEVLAANTYSKIDPDFKQFSDWIELYNNDNSAKDIGGYYLSDDANNRTKWKIPDNTIIPAKGYLLIWADKKNSGLHTNFSLSADESITLYDRGENIIDSVKLDKQESDISSIKIDDKIYYTNPTPAKANTVAHGKLWKSKKPNFSMKSGFYNGTLLVELTTKNTGDVYYTIDGSIPTTSSPKYTKPLSISNTTVIRARTLESGKFLSTIVNKTYLLNENITLPVVSIAINDEYLYDEKIGIHTIGTDENGNLNPLPDVGDWKSANFFKDWMRPASIEYIKDGESKFSENIGIRIFGAGSRVRPQKSLAIFAKDRYGKKSINYKLFPDKPQIKKVKSFILRNSGSDRTFLMKDALTQAIIRDNMDIDYQSYHPVIAFINGEYWGVLNLREKLNEDYIEANHDISPDKVDIVGRKNEILSGDNSDYLDLLDYVQQNDMSNDTFYQIASNKIDITAYINYYIAQLYVGNWDWPDRNIKYWKEQSENGLWRWMIFDTDDGFGDKDPAENNTFEQILSPDAPSAGSPLRSTILIRALMQNSTFKNEFISRFTSHLNTTFEPARIENIISQIKAPLIPEFERHFIKWIEIDPRLKNHNFNGWGNRVDRLSNFSNIRDMHLRGYMSSYLGASGSFVLHIALADNGTLSVDGIELDGNYNGEYFNNAKVTLKAIPKQGYKFIKWSNNETDQSINITLNNDTSISAIFEDVVLPKIVINEINYKSANDFNTGDWIELYNNDSKTIDISGWELKDDKDSSSFIIPNGTTLTPGSFIIFAQDATNFNNLVSNVAAIGNIGFGLSKLGDSIRVFDNQNMLIDSVTYNESWTLPSEDGETLSLLDPNSDNSLSSNWSISNNHGTPKDSNQ